MAAINMNTELFLKNITTEDKPVLIEYWAPWCVYCRRISPALDKISEQYADSVVVGQINIDEESQLAQEEQIEVIPTLVLYQKGQALGSIVAPDSKARIEAFLEETLNR
ncbi:MAG: thioredoxin [Lachnospiraceae bacterium]|nr:thioredoxin [Lachnospiraceae bacterium]